MKKAAFDFKHNISPSYIGPLLLRLEAGQWYNYEDLKGLLRSSGLHIDGTDIVRYNVAAWIRSGIVYVQKEKPRNYIQISLLGQYLCEVYSTNQDLFFDLIHFVFYSTWKRSADIGKVRFWLYAHVCDALWHTAPSLMDTAKLTNHLQVEAQQLFPEYNPAFAQRSVQGIFPWLAALVPPFLAKVGTKLQYHSRRRDYCTPQLFHLATDLIYNDEQINYGTSIALSEKHIENICRACLLDPAKFWPIADLTAMMIHEFSIQRSQWGRSIVLSGPPSWIDLPDFSAENETAGEEAEDGLDIGDKNINEPGNDRDEGDDDEEGELWI